ncbi:hypothetical protein RND71_010726 [Anisodus tanguticus]|uniref:Serine hydroxymethyltransferase-like domain-containing protein n=1 Tax=Anisodus tanguticus TaxID=243964 RepID=A0AAE1SKC8_9SOLA|nr:hypothetical protein RND71_010726 [Anisodus tanguticus]
MFHTISTVKCDSSNLFKFDEILLTIPCMLSTCIPARGFFVYLAFSNLPFDTDVYDITLPYSANETMFTDSSFLSTYILVVARRGEQVCGLGLKHVSTYAPEHFSSSLEVLLALHPFSLVRHMWITQWNALLEHINSDCASILKLEKARQWQGLEFIPLVNLMPVVSSLLTMTYSERHLGPKYNGGNEYIDLIERLCQACALEF